MVGAEYLLRQNGKMIFQLSAIGLKPTGMRKALSATA